MDRLKIVGMVTTMKLLFLERFGQRSTECFIETATYFLAV